MKPRQYGRNTWAHSALTVLLVTNLSFWPPALVEAFSIGPFRFGASEPSAQKEAFDFSNPPESVTSHLKFKPVSDALISSGNLVEFKLQAISPAANPVHFEIEELPDGAFLIDGQFRWQPPGDWVGEKKLTFRATDGVETVEQVITLFFLPPSKFPAEQAWPGEDDTRQGGRRSALVLPDEKGWIVVIPSSTQKVVSKKATERLDQHGEQGEGEFRLGEESDLSTSGQGASGDDLIVVYDPFFSRPILGGTTPKNATPADGKTGGTGGPDGTGDEGEGDEEPQPSNPGEEQDFNLGIRFFDHTGGRNGLVPSFNPVTHHTFQSVNIFAGVGNVFGRAAAFGDLQGHNDADSSRNLQDIYVANPYRQIDLSGFSPPPAARNTFLVNNAESVGEITFRDRTIALNAEMNQPPSELDRPQAVLFGDLDGDGLRDVFIPNLGRPNILLKSQGANLPFLDISSASAVNESSEARAAVLADFNLDGALDVYVANGSSPSRLYMNLGNGTFFDAAGLLGLQGTGRSVGVVAFDADNDGDSEIYLLNFSGSNHLYKNLLQETAVLSFTEVGGSAGLALAGAPSGAEIGDLDNDGDYDLFISDLAAGGARLLRNDSSAGNILFTDQTSKLNSALGGASLPATTGCAFLDIDNQGLLDVYAITENDENIMLGNQGGFNFSDITAAEVVAFPLFADSVATGDYNHDHRTDIFISSTPSLLYKNISSHSNHYLEVVLKPTSVETNADGIGARVEVTRSDSIKLTQQVIGGTGRSQDSTTLLFGMGNNTRAESIKVFWPDALGRSTVLMDSDPEVDLHADQTLVITGNAAPEIMVLSDHFEAPAGMASSFELATKDVNGNPVALTFAVLGGPLNSSNASVHKIVSDGINTTWRFTFTPHEAGEVILRFFADDGLAPASGTKDITVTVLSQAVFNHPPFFADPLPESVSVLAGKVMNEIEILARDSDNISAGILNALVTVNPALPVGTRPALLDLNNPAVTVSSEGKSRAMALKWTPTTDLSGSFEVTVTLDDGIASAEDTFTILVEALPPSEDHEPPAFVSSIPADSSTVLELNTVEFILSDNVGVDEVGTGIAATRDGASLSEGAANDFTRDHSVENRILLTLNFPSEGVYVFSVTSKDTSGNLGIPVAVTITDAPDAPTLFQDRALGQEGYFGSGPHLVPPEAQIALVGDYNGDTNGATSRGGSSNALEDLLILSGISSPTKLFQLNSLNGPYEDASQTAGITSNLSSTGAVFFDLNGDGFRDIYSVQNGPNQLFISNGDGTFGTDIASLAGSADNGNGRGALVGDLDENGLLDLYLLNNGRNVLYLNRSTGPAITFVNASEGVNDTETSGSETADSVAGLVFDPDDDGDWDIFVVNANESNRLFLNPGVPLGGSNPLGAFAEFAGPLGLADDASGKTALAATDVNGDRSVDLLVLNSDPAECKLLIQDLDNRVSVNGVEIGKFKSSSAGLDFAAHFSISAPAVRDAVFMDFDNDGDQDLAVAALGTGNESEILLYQNNGRAEFSLRSDTGFSVRNMQVRSLTSVDINQDGRIDLIAVGNSTKVFINQVSNDNAYLQVALEGVVSNRHGLGSAVLVKPETITEAFSHLLLAGTGRGQNSGIVHFGLGNLGLLPGTIEHVVVSWPRGIVTFIDAGGSLGPFFSNQRMPVSELGFSEVFMNVSLVHNPDYQAPDLNSDIIFQLVDIAVNVEGVILEQNGVENGIVPFRQYLLVDFSLPPADNLFASIVASTDNRNGEPAYTGADREKAAGLVGETDGSFTVPLLWKVYNDSSIPGVVEPGRFIGDAFVTEGLIQDKAQSAYNNLDAQVLRELVTNLNGGTLGLFPTENIATRVLDPVGKIRVYLAADFSSPPNGSTWPPQKYKTSRLTLELTVDGV
ncbi:MAG: VCBS repeat-containing protein [Candidatus Omnitrophica bacterium]|nr:VCBS repeat-containing protein [Candidatus Omnitrophota bacterium]